MKIYASYDRFELSIWTGDSAIAENREGEIARILRETALQVETGANSGCARGINGNTVCRWRFLDRD